MPRPRSRTVIRIRCLGFFDFYGDCASIVAYITDCVHRIEQEIDQHLLDLHPIADDRRPRRQSHFNRHPPTLRLDVQQRRYLVDRGVKIQPALLDLVPCQQRSQSAYHLAGTDVIAADVGQDLAQYLVTAVARRYQKIGRVDVA